MRRHIDRDDVRSKFDGWAAGEIVDDPIHLVKRLPDRVQAHIAWLEFAIEERFDIAHCDREMIA